jgi:hypothetical protein
MEIGLFFGGGVFRDRLREEIKERETKEIPGNKETI